MSKYRTAAKLGFVLLLLLNACSLQNESNTPTAVPVETTERKIARREVLTATPVATASPTASATALPTEIPTRTATPTATAKPTLTPTVTPTANPYAPQSTLGGSRNVPRARVLNIAPVPNLQVSPALFGLNYWVPPFGPTVRQELAPLNTVVLRHGGENGEESPLDFSELDRFILDARAINAEPMIQVPYTGSNPAFAARMVRYVNVQKKYDVRFWSIGNEEDKNKRGGAKEKWINTWRSFRDAMKAVDDRIVIFGPEYAQAYDFTRPDDDWLTPFLRKNGDAVDVISLHRYPFNGGQSNRTVLVGDALNTAKRVKALRDHIKRITGRDIPLAFTEMNLSGNWREGGEGSSASFSAGLWMAETLGQMAEAGVAMVNVWNARSPDSLGIIAQPPREQRPAPDVLRPTYYALALYAGYGDRLVPLASHVSNITAHAARDSRTGIVTIVLVNRSGKEIPFKLEFNSNQEPQQGHVYFDLSTRKSIPFDMPAESMASFTLDANRNVTRTFLYSRAMFSNNQSPQVTP